MSDPVPLTDGQAGRLNTVLRHGRDLDAAATELGIDLRAVWARTRTDTRLAIGLAGHEPDVHRNAATPCGPTAEACRGDDRTFTAACDAVSAPHPPCGASRVIRLTPQRVARFLGELTEPGATVIAAAATIGVSSAAIYQRLGREAEFARAMDAARASTRQGLCAAVRPTSLGCGGEVVPARRR